MSTYYFAANPVGNGSGYRATVSSDDWAQVKLLGTRKTREDAVALCRFRAEKIRAMALAAGRPEPTIITP